MAEICFWTDVAGATQVCADVSLTEDVVLWGAETGTGGVQFLASDERNTEFSGATTVFVTSYYVPTLGNSEPTDTQVDLSAFAETALAPPIELSFNGAYWGVSFGVTDELPIGDWLYLRIEIDGAASVLAMAKNAPGF